MLRYYEPDSYFSTKACPTRVRFSCVAMRSVLRLFLRKPFIFLRPFIDDAAALDIHVTFNAKKCTALVTQAGLTPILKLIDTRYDTGPKPSDNSWVLVFCFRP